MVRQISHYNQKRTTSFRYGVATKGSTLCVPASVPLVRSTYVRTYTCTTPVPYQWCHVVVMWWYPEHVAGMCTTIIGSYSTNGTTNTYEDVLLEYYHGTTNGTIWYHQVVVHMYVRVPYQLLVWYQVLVLVPW
jgi:hypothetical protein